MHPSTERCSRSRAINLVESLQHRSFQSVEDGSDPFIPAGMQRGDRNRVIALLRVGATEHQACHQHV